MDMIDIVAIAMAVVFAAWEITQWQNSPPRKGGYFFFK